MAFEYVFGLKNTFYQGIESSNRILLLLSNNSSYLAPESVRRIGMYLLAFYFCPNIPNKFHTGSVTKTHVKVQLSVIQNPTAGTQK